MSRHNPAATPGKKQTQQRNETKSKTTKTTPKQAKPQAAESDRLASTTTSIEGVEVDAETRAPPQPGAPRSHRASRTDWHDNSPICDPVASNDTAV